MDATRLDRLARLLAGKGPRRGALAALAGFAVAAGSGRAAAPAGCAGCGECEECRDGACAPRDGACAPRDGGPCRDDGVSCTVARCVAGRCVHTPDDARCPNPGPCTASACDGVRGCMTIPLPDGVNPVGCLASDDPCRPRACLDGICAEQALPDGAVCGDGRVCSAGVCCRAGSITCDGRCVEPETNPDHCGGCDVRCEGGRCCGGRCAPAGACCTAGRRGCPAGAACRAGRCVRVAGPEAAAAGAATATAAATAASFPPVRSCGGGKRSCPAADGDALRSRCCPRAAACGFSPGGAALCLRKPRA
jgi:hypothetical protein